MRMKKIYLDYAASTPINILSFLGMLKNSFFFYANPSAKNAFGKLSKKRLEERRFWLKNLIKASDPEEIIFTSGGTESNSLAIYSFFKNLQKEGKSLKDFSALTSTIEHSSVLDTFKSLEEDGLEVHYIKIKENGVLDLKDLEEKIKNNTIFCSFMAVNNETGAIFPLKKISEILKKAEEKFSIEKIFFHTDSCQMPLYFKIDVNSLGIDMMSFCAQKIYGPKGIGFLYKRKSVKLKGIFGGSQEFGLRGGTQPTFLISAMVNAFREGKENMENFNKKMLSLKEFFLEELDKENVFYKINGDKNFCVSAILNLTFPKINLGSDEIVFLLSEENIFVSSKSACIAGDKKESYVVAQMLGEEAKNSLRFSMGRKTKKSDLKKVVKVLKKIQEKQKI